MAQRNPQTFSTEMLAALEAVTTEHDSLLIVHSSLPKLGIDPVAAKWDILRVVRHLASLGKTLAFPTFTLSFCEGTEFNINESPSETGILGQWVLELDGAIRSSHPIYSFAVIGPLSKEIAGCQNTTTFGDDSTFALFERENARLIMLGAGWDSCTQFHRYEEAAQTPYRHYKDFSGRANMGQGEGEQKARMFVRELIVDAQNDFTAAVDWMENGQHISKALLGPGLVQSAHCSDVRNACTTLLTANPYALVQQPRRVEYAVAMRSQADATAPIKVAVLGSSNVEFLKTAILSSLREYIDDRHVEVYAAPFGRALREMALSQSELTEFKPDFVFFMDRAEDLFNIGRLEELLAKDDTVQILEERLDVLESFARSNGGWFFVASFARVGQPVLSNVDLLSEQGTARLIGELNDRIVARCDASGPLHLVDMERLAATFTGGPVFDARLWHLGRFPYSKPFSSYVAETIAGLVMAATGRTSRLLVLDLDNTLWGGLVGEDGIEGLQIGGDYPGNAFADFQRCLKLLALRGIALAVASKNDEDLAIQVIDKHPEMVLRSDDFAAYRINWGQKWQSIEEIADELNLGLRNVLFIDDNPVEREHVRQQLPMVTVLEMPDDPALFAHTLLTSPYLESVGITAEDKTRTRNYLGRRKAEQTRTQYERMDDFYASLNSQLTLVHVDPTNMSRAVQLINKTTQFNTTTRVYSQTDVEALLGDADASVVVLGYEDRFTEYENIGVLIARWHNPDNTTAAIDSFLMSCRVLGRGVESGVLAWVAEQAQQRSINRIVGDIIPTVRNKPAQSLFADHGFVNSGGNTWELSLADSKLDWPHWLRMANSS